MSFQTSILGIDKRTRQQVVTIKSPSNYYLSPPIPLDYYAPLPPLTENPLLELRRPTNKDACFAISALSPRLPTPYTTEHESIGTTLLDRFLYQQAESPLPATGLLTPIQAGPQLPMAPPQAMQNLWAYAQTPLSPRNPRNVWAFMNNSQWVPPPPPSGPPPSSGRHARIASIEEIYEPNLGYQGQDMDNATTRAAAIFRQPPQCQAPETLENRSIIPQPTAAPFMQQLPSQLPQPSFLPTETAPLKRRVPISINVQAARDDARAKLEGLGSTPGSAGTTGSVTPRGRVVSPGRRVVLSPINTQVISTETGQKLRVDVLVSPVMSPVLSDPKSPFFSHRNSRSSTPPLWSPQTPMAMSFDFPVVISDGTPPLAALGWTENIRETIIEEDIQDATPLDLDPPRGRISATIFGPGSSPIRDSPRSKRSPRRARARSVSPPRSAHPNGSSFDWSPSQIYNRYATDEAFDVASPLVEPQQMIEAPTRSKGYVPNGLGMVASNPRQAILGTYFKRQPSQDSLMLC